jgi:hypothetical protein
MDAQTVSDVLKPLIVPAIGALLTVTARAIVKLVRRLRRRPAEPEPAADPGTADEAKHVVLPDWVQARLKATSPAEPQPEPPGLVARWLGRLPVLPRRANVWRGTAIGGLLVGFGVAGYFRTAADVVIGLVLTTPVFVALAFVPTDTGSGSSSSSSQSPSPWALGVIYSTMALTGVYSYLRATSSNRRLEATVPSGRDEPTRQDVFERELGILAADRWKVQSRGDFEAVLVRTKRPNHWLHLALTLVTFYLWAFVWIAKTRESRRNPQSEYRRLSVDTRGNWSLEPWPTEGADTAGLAAG